MKAFIQMLVIAAGLGIGAGYAADDSFDVAGTPGTAGSRDTNTLRSVRVPRARKPKELGPNDAVDPRLIVGHGISQHDFLIAGEEDRRRPTIRLYLVETGKLVWTYQMQRITTNGTENSFSDIHRLSNGDILFAYQSGWRKIDKDGKIIFDYVCPGCSLGTSNMWTECHSAQPIGDDKVLFAQNGLPMLKVILYNIKTGKVEMEHEVRTKYSNRPNYLHSQTRRVRLTRAGTYLIAHLDIGRVIEYDKEWNEIWSYDAPAVWDAVRLTNGNTLISGNMRNYVREIDPKGATVWEVSTNNFPELKFKFLHEASRLANGNTVFCNWVRRVGSSPAGDRTVQVVEVNPKKELVWTLSQWRDPDLGPASCVQLLDDTGRDENQELMR
jgi:hypothetical protein